ncbi:hypothetical protein J6590_107484, partial [Homalodisca vitripennis]
GYRDHEGGSSRMRPFHCTTVVLTPANAPNVGHRLSATRDKRCNPIIIVQFISREVRTWRSPLRRSNEKASDHGPVPKTKIINDISKARQVMGERAYRSKATKSSGVKDLFYHQESILLAGGREGVNVNNRRHCQLVVNE